jgi:sarcosine oxidase subunit alpha
MVKRVANVTRGVAIGIVVDGKRLSAFEGESLATVLLANGISAFHRSAKAAARAPFCGMGVCFECLVRVNETWVRACVTPAEDGTEVTTGARLCARRLDGTHE